MAKNTIAYYTKSGRTKASNLTISTPGSVSVTLFTAGTEGSKVLQIRETLVTIAALGKYYLNDGVTDHLLSLTSVTTTSGTDVLDATLFPKAPNGMRYINLETGWSIKFTSNTNPCNTDFLVYGEDF